MTTIPIEVIVQDAESPVDPTPTPVDPADQGENTNTTAPYTGVGTMDNNSGITSSSAAISIVSIVIAVLAIGAVIALLARKHYKYKKASVETGMTRQERKAIAATSTIAVLALTVLLGQLVVAGVVSPIATNAATDDVASDEAELDVDSKITIIATRTEDEDTVVATVKNTSTITVDKPFGYEVAISMAGDTTNLYLDGDETSEYYLSPVEDDTLSDNTWGYTLDEEEYNAVPLADDLVVISKGTTPVADEDIDIYYGIKVDKDLPAGIYTGELEYTLSDTGFPLSLRTMQQMTSDICEAAYTPSGTETVVPTATLTDIRDDKTYTIAKLADGNCWMTQNLDLDLNNQTALTPENTNISANWTPANSTISFTGTTVDGWQNSNNVQYSADPGDVYYYTSGTNDDDIKYNSLAECETADHTDCSHYHAGNYYNWPAAVASNDTSSMTEEFENAPGSICPAGWRLPKNANSTGDMSKNEQITMISSYDNILGDYIASGTPPYYEYLTNGFKLIRANPLWISRAGFISWGSTSALGSSAEYWSSTRGDSNSYSYRLYIGYDRVMPASSTGARYGNSIRCLAE